MCMRRSSIRSHQQWNWSGDEIVYLPVVEASRYLPDGTHRRYPIDIRQFLGSDGNAVVRQSLDAFVDSLPGSEQEAFRHGVRGTFDRRATLLLRLVRAIKYQTRDRGMDAWYFPEETLARGRGDCEDRAFLLAALLLESGISSYCVRLAFGHVQDFLAPKQRKFDHAWVMYKNEGGAWEILETVAQPGVRQGSRGSAKRPGQPKPRKPLPQADIEYVPHFVFNRSHLWRVRSGQPSATRPLRDYIEDRKFWQGFSPAFGARVHETIVEAAIGDRVTPDLLARLERTSLLADVNVLTYDPREHFDFAYVAQGWRLVLSRLKTASVQDLGLAIHSIADFYAHTLYAEFASKTRDGRIALFDPAAPDFSRCTYDFSNYELPASRLDATKAARLWSGNLISGQWWRYYTTFPDELKNAPDFWKRRCLPDHDAIAVDTPLPKPAHRRYDEAEHQLQFALRSQAAVLHVRLAYERAAAVAAANGGWSD
jgi:hypothetical protein